MGTYRFRSIAFLTVTIFILLFLPQTRALALLNLGQLRRTALKLHTGTLSKEMANVFLQSLELWPDNPHIRWQTGVALLDAERHVEAASVLWPLKERRQLSQLNLPVLIRALAKAGRGHDAITAYEALSANGAINLQKHMAVLLAYLYIQAEGQIPLEHAPAILSPSFGLNVGSPEFQLLMEHMARDGFWQSDVATRVRTALAWQMDEVGSQAIVGAGAPDTSDDAETVARILGVSTTDVWLGTDLSSDGDFESKTCPTIVTRACEPQGWLLSFMTTGNPWNRAAFVVGLDTHQPYSGTQALRIEGLVLERDDRREPARAGLWHSPIPVAPDTPYAISFVYRTQSVANEPGATLWVSENPLVFFGGDYRLPVTRGKWHRVTMIVWNRSGAPAEVHPLVRSFSEGSVWFDDFTVRPLQAPVSAHAVPQDPIVNIHAVR